MNFQNLEHLKALFISGRFPFPDEITIANIKYKSNRTSEYDLKDMIEKQYKGMWVYVTNLRKQSTAAGLNQYVVFLWAFRPDLKMVPYDVRSISKARMTGPIVERQDNGDSINIRKEQIVGDVVDILITSIPGSNPIKGKIDTGADVSSLHATEWNINDGRVTFIAPDLSENKITMPVLEKQAVKLSNGNMEYRPVIELNVKINEQQLTNCMFNLNDRGAMTYPVLIGQNVLEAGGFMVDPSIDAAEDLNVEIDKDPKAGKEIHAGHDMDTSPDMYEDFEVNWEALQEMFKDDVIPSDEELLQSIIRFINR